MKNFFARITALSLRFKWITLILSALVSIAGIVAITQLRQELIPAVSFPQTIILAQASGMTSDQVLSIVTERLEAAIDEVPQVANLESTTTGSFGAVITARNDFGQNQDRIQDAIVAAIDTVWLPLRRIAPADGADVQAFADQLLVDLPADVLLYIEERDSNFLFQLSPDVWSKLSDDTVTTLLGYMASTLQGGTADSALRQLVDQEIVPALENLAQIGTTSVSGGQALPDENGMMPVSAPPSDTEPRSVMLQLSPEVWAVVSAKVGYTGPLDDAAAEALALEVALPETAPALPESWQVDHFSTASDLIEMRSLTRTIGAVFNTFATQGTITGSLGQTDDLTPDTITQMLAIDPTMVEYFKAEHLAAMSADVFAALPADFIAGLDGFTRDELAARALAASITGEDAAPAPVDLPAAWRISPPSLITFSFDDLPLATFSIADTSAVVMETAPTEAPVSESGTDDVAQNETTDAQTLPEGPALPFTFGLLGTFIGVELNSADDLVLVQLPENLASQFGASELSGAQLLNFLLLLSDPSALPEGVEAPQIPINPADLISTISADAISFIAENDPTFLTTISPDVFNAFSDDVLSRPELAPVLDGVWNTLANQPQFAARPLRTAADIIALGDGSASSVLNTINATVPEGFGGYEVRLFDSLTPATLRYFALQQPDDFYAELDAQVIGKLSPTALALIPEDVTAGLDADVRDSIAAIISGEQPSAAAALAELYTTDAPPADPNAPALTDDWQFVGDFIGVELNSADDFFRFFPDPTNFLNSFFDTANGAAFAPNLYGGLTPEAVTYMIGRDPALFDGVRIEGLQLMTPEALAALPQSVQDRAVSGAAPFSPSNPVTRTDGQNSLFITVYKDGDANTVEAYHLAEDAVEEVLAEYPNIELAVSFEQASFIEESISGVAREGGLGAVFAVVVILIFLSSGIWSFSPRRITGAVLVAIFLVVLALLVTSTAATTGGDLTAAWDQTDVLYRAMLILGIGAGLFIILWPRNLPRPAWRSTIVTGVSIPLSVLMAMALMRWLPPAVNGVLAPVAEGNALLTFLIRLFPESLTINIMTLSGLTVAIGRVVDDSIVVLENIFRQIQEGEDKRTAIIAGVRDVSVAIFAATVITVVVFLPLGLTGGIIGEFFLPFGLAVTYALLASFVVAITAVPVVAYLLLSKEEMAEEAHDGALERLYRPALKWALDKPAHKLIVLVFAFLSLVVGGALFAGRPQAFLPSFGEPQISVAVSMPPGTKITELNPLVEQLEAFIAEDLPAGEVSRVQTIVGSAGFNLQSLLTGGGGVSENIASITIAIEDQGLLDSLTGELRAAAEDIFGVGNVSVSAASLSEQGFGGFALVLAGEQADLVAANDTVVATLEEVEGLSNVRSNLAGFGGAAGDDAPPTYIRIDGQAALRYTAELETQNTLGVTAAAKEAVLGIPDLPASITVSEGYETQLQTQGFANLFVAMGIAIVIVVALLMLTFRSVVHWLDIILSIIVAPVGAAILLTLTDRVLGISALIGLLMLIGIVVTNAVVLIDRVQSNMRERHMNVYDALLEAGQRRLRPIIMTALATIGALMPLAVGLSKGAIIASELGTVVIGGLFSSTLLTLLVVPVAFSLLHPLHKRLAGLVGGKK
ncbi:MAG: efflux RND transporter permease subunit [Pleurocapsa minor GSE-CHR-MK-17-07R]|jgi:multidrug efflux pump subunit AcrB|nr:efflux RND transporter permease subunit [Pleurocapsa minor GSE-CHR-MK 17-07R]